jgi:hypothetical protein
MNTLEWGLLFLKRKLVIFSNINKNGLFLILIKERK